MDVGLPFEEAAPEPLVDAVTAADQEPTTEEEPVVEDETIVDIESVLVGNHTPDNETPEIQTPDEGPDEEPLAFEPVVELAPEAQPTRRPAPAARPVELDRDRERAGVPAGDRPPRRRAGRQRRAADQRAEERRRQSGAASKPTSTSPSGESRSSKSGRPASTLWPMSCARRPRSSKGSTAFSREASAGARAAGPRRRSPRRSPRSRSDDRLGGRGCGGAAEPRRRMRRRHRRRRSGGPGRSRESPHDRPGRGARRITAEMSETNPGVSSRVPPIARSRPSATSRCGKRRCASASLKRFQAPRPDCGGGASRGRHRPAAAPVSAGSRSPAPPG